MNKTQKNTSNSLGKRLIIDLNNNKYFESTNTDIESLPIIPKIQVIPQDPPKIQVIPQELPVYSYENTSSNNTNTSCNNTNTTAPSNLNLAISSEGESIDLHIPKINRTTRTYKYTLGKKNGSKYIGLLLKNRETQKKIKQEVIQLKQKPIQEIKNYLRTKNLIKLGSQAPNDVLRKLYEDSILAGEITNNNASNLVFNFIN